MLINMGFIGHLSGGGIRRSLREIYVAAAGQSQAVYLGQYGADAFEAEALALGFDVAQFEEASVGGASVRKDSGAPTYYWVDTDTMARGNAYSAHFMADIASKFTGGAAAITHVVWFGQGDADIANLTSGTITKTQYKAALELVFGWMFEDLPNLRKIIIAPYNRRVATGADVGAQLAREAALEIIAANSWAVPTASYYDLDMGTDAPHLNTDQNPIAAERLARTIAYEEGKTAITGTLGPVISAASALTDRVRCTITHDGGSDYAVMSDVDYMMFNNNGTLKTFASAAKVDETTLDLFFPSNVGPIATANLSLLTMYGASGLAGDDPGVLLDNAADPLPLRAGSVVASNDDPIVALDNLVIYLSAKASAKTYSSGSNIQQIDKIAGSIAKATRTAAGNEPVYDDTLFNNAGGWSHPDGSTAINYSGFTAGQTHTIGFVFKAPASAPASIEYVFGFAAGSIDAQARLMVGTNNALFWYTNEAGSAAQITPILTGDQKVFVLMEFASTGVANVYVDGALYATFDPRNATDYESRSEIIIGAGVSAASCAFGAWFHTTDVLSAEERAAVAEFLMTQFSI